MGIKYRSEQDGRLSVQEMDDNFHYIEEQLAGLTPSNSQTPTFAQVTQEGNTTTQSFYQSISLGEGDITINTGVFGSFSDTTNPLTNGIQYVLNGVTIATTGFASAELPVIRFSSNIPELQKELFFSLPFEKENPSYPTASLYTLATTDDLPKVFKGVFNQTGTASPVVQEYYNNTGYDFTNWARGQDGIYTLSVDGNGASFSYINVGQNYLGGELSKTIAYTAFNYKSGYQDYYVYTYDDGTLSDSIAYNMFIEIGLK